MNKEYVFALTDEHKLWRNSDNHEEHFVELNFNFTRPLAHAEQNKAITHFMNGLVQFNLTEAYIIYTVDFCNPEMMILTFRNLQVDMQRGLLQIIIEFRKLFPVKPPKVLFDIHNPPPLQASKSVLD
ncbi:hypothetical protein QUF64_11230 [Anaerolineales bacterium HSG6]|nr:hypothetical protein [Anaerolineales bacterium HSG6]MDM8530623.1 hypothetical protein [Anaerolineales bacterium HSG25]